MSAPKQRPILFSGPMVRAILDGSKSVTRRVVKPQPVDDHDAEPGSIVWHCGELRRCREPYGFQERLTGRLVAEARVPCPYGQPGDLLYVREAWRYRGSTSTVRPGDADWTYESRVVYRADEELRTIPGKHRAPPFNPPAERGRPEYHEYSRAYFRRWRPSIHMPKWAARIWLRVTEVSVERVQEITEADARAEGVAPVSCEPASIVFGTWSARHRYRDAFRALWDEINADRGHPWESNPWVWHVAFERVEAP